MTNSSQYCTPGCNQCNEGTKRNEKYKDWNIRNTTTVIHRLYHCISRKSKRVYKLLEYVNLASC